MASELYPSKVVKIGDFQVKDLYKRFLFMSAIPIRYSHKATIGNFALQSYNIILD